MAKNLKDLIDIDLLAYFKSKLDLLFANKVDKENGKGLSSNDYTSDEKTKLANIATGAQVNTIEGIQIVGNTVSPTNKIVNIPAVTQSSPGVMTAADKKKLDGVDTGAQVNVIETVKLHGTALPVTSKAVDISVLPSGGSDGQVLQRVGANDYSVGWTTLPTIAWHTVSVNDMDEDGMLPSGGDLSITDILRELTNGKLPIIQCTDNNVKYNLIHTYGRTVPMYFCCIDKSGILHVLWLDYVGEETSGGGREVAWFYSVTTLDQSSELGTAVDGLSERITQMSLYLDEKKVNKEDGKGLSTNDYTTAEKNKLSGIAAGAQVNVVTDASSTGSGASQTMTVSKGSTNYTTYTKAALDSALGEKAAASSVYTKTEIDQKLVGAMNYKGTKATKADLPASGNAQGDVWHITADGSEWAWNGSTWEELGTALDLSGYVEESEVGLATNDDIDALFT